MHRARISRRGIAWGGVAFLLLQFLLGIVTDQAAMPVRDPEYSFREHQLRELRWQHPDRKVTVLLGTSRTMLGVNASRLTQSGTDLYYNFGMPAAGPARQLLAWRRLVASGLKPDAVAIEVLPALHTQEGQRLFEAQWSDPARLSCREVWDMLPTYVEPIRGAWRWGLSRFAPLTRYSTTSYRNYFTAGEGYNAPSSEGIPTDDFGWRQGCSVHCWEACEREQATQRLLHQYRRACEDTRPAPAEPLLEVLLTELREANVSAIVFTMPEGSRFHAQAVNAELAVGRVAEMCQRQCVRFVDLRRELPDGAFYDGHHLHPETADAFTMTFARKVIAIESTPMRNDVATPNQVPEQMLADARVIPVQELVRCRIFTWKSIRPMRTLSLPIEMMPGD